MNWGFRVLIILAALVAFFYGLAIMEEVAIALEFGAPLQLVLVQLIIAVTLGAVASITILYSTYKLLQDSKKG